MAHLYAAYRCSFCNEIPETAPIYHCPNRHQYCFECFRKLQRLYRGNVDGGGCCLICKYSGRFEKSDVNSEFLKKLKMKPGIGRPFRYNTKKFHLNSKINDNPDQNESDEIEKNQGDGYPLKSLKLVRSVSATTMSRRPLTCLHDGCKKSVAVSSLVSHFKHDHGAVPCFGIEKGRELRLLFDVSLVEHDKTFCLAMITVYEFNKIDVVRSKSSQSVINTCSKLSGRVPLNTFWLMMSGSTDHRKATSYVIFWLYSNSEDRYWCTMELSSKNDKISVSSFCNAVGLHESRTVDEVARNMNCLYVSHGSFVALLDEGDKNSYNLGTTIRHAGVIGLWASPVNGKKAGVKPGPPAMRHTGFGKLGGLINTAVHATKRAPGNGDVQWCFAQVKGTLDDDVTEADIISCVEFNHDGELLATGDKGGRVVIFQRDPSSKTALPRRGEYNVYSTFQSHEPEFDYLKSLEIEEKINKIRWLKRRNPAHFLLSTNDKTIKLWKVSERDKKVEGYNTRLENGSLIDPMNVNSLRVPTIKPMELMVEASPRRIFANAHTYHINSISVNSDQETYLSADDLRINLWHLEITDQSFNIVDIKPTNMEELTEVITAAEFHPVECNLFVYSSSKGTIRLCDMRAAALCDRHAKLFEEPEDPTNRSFFSEIISSISDVKLSNNGRYMISRDYLSVKVWDLHMETKPIETYPVHEYLRSKLCSLYENDCIFDKFECCWNGNDMAIMTGSYNNFFRMFDRTTKREVTLEASKDIAKPKTILKPRKVCSGGKRKKDEISVDCLDFNKKILHTAWHPTENIIAVAATNNLFLFQDKF